MCGTFISKIMKKNKCNKSNIIFRCFTTTLFVAHTMCCTVMVLSDEQLLVDRWHFFHDLQTQRCSPQDCHCTEIMLGKLMFLVSLTAPLLELHDVLQLLSVEHFQSLIFWRCAAVVVGLQKYKIDSVEWKKCLLYCLLALHSGSHYFSQNLHSLSTQWSILMHHGRTSSIRSCRSSEQDWLSQKDLTASEGEHARSRKNINSQITCTLKENTTQTLMARGRKCIQHEKRRCRVLMLRFSRTVGASKGLLLSYLPTLMEGLPFRG